MVGKKSSVVSYKDLVVWQRSIELVVAVYELTEQFPPEEKFGLASQMRRAAISVPSNIAEGKSRRTKKDYTHFMRIAYGSASELETQIIVCKKLPFGKQLDYNVADGFLEEVLKMLNVMTSKLTT